jgi:hypothetical protein
VTTYKTTCFRTSNITGARFLLDRVHYRPDLLIRSDFGNNGIPSGRRRGLNDPIRLFPPNYPC